MPIGAGRARCCPPSSSSSPPSTPRSRSPRSTSTRSRPWRSATGFAAFRTSPCSATASWPRKSSATSRKPRSRPASARGVVRAPTASLGGFVVSRLEGQVEILPVRHPPQLGELQHDPALRLKDGVVDRVQIVADRLIDPTRKLWVVALGVAHHQLANVLGNHPLTGQPQLLEPSQELVQGRYSPIRQPHRGVRQLSLSGRLRHGANRRLVMGRRLCCHSHFLKHRHSL